MLHRVPELLKGLVGFHIKRQEPSCYAKEAAEQGVTNQTPKVVNTHPSSENMLASAGKFHEDCHHLHCQSTGLLRSHQPADSSQYGQLVLASKYLCCAFEFRDDLLWVGLDSDPELLPVSECSKRSVSDQRNHQPSPEKEEYVIAPRQLAETQRIQSHEVSYTP